MNPTKIMIGYKTFFYLLLFMLSLGSGLQAQVDNPEGQLKDTVGKVIDTLYDTSTDLDSRQDRLMEVMEGSFSFELISRRVMGREWNRFNEEEKARFTKLFSELLIQSYTSGLEGKALENKPEITWTGQRELKPGLMEITSSIALEGSQYPIRYRLAKLKDEGWMVYDVMVEGLSLVSNYREQFNSLVQRGSTESLFTAMEDKIEANRAN